MGLLSFTPELHQAAEGQLPPLTDAQGKTVKRTRIQVYKNTFIEKYFAQAHPSTPGIWFGWLIVWGLYSGITSFGAAKGLGLFAAGLLITTLIEYNLHRFIFHMNTYDEASRLRVFLMHGYHHDFPDDPMRLVLPPIAIWPIAAVLGVIWYFVFGQYWFVIYAGTAAGYVAYDWTHYYTHHFNPKSGPGKWLKRYHMLHHHDSPMHRFGITSPLWDVVFGTYLSNKKLIRDPRAKH